MGEYHVRGGKRLTGTLSIGGGKNAILPILASVVLNGGKSVIHNCPLISDTLVSIKMLEAIGCEVRLDGSTMTVDSAGASRHELPEALVREMRSSFIFLGGVLGRFGKVKIGYPGGCDVLLERMACRETPMTHSGLYKLPRFIALLPGPHGRKPLSDEPCRYFLRRCPGFFLRV